MQAFITEGNSRIIDNEVGPARRDRPQTLFVSVEVDPIFGPVMLPRDNLELFTGIWVKGMCDPKTFRRAVFIVCS